MNKKFLLIILCLLFALPVFATRKIQWCEVDVSLTSSGRQDITYRVKYVFPHDSMSGFDMEGFGKAQPFFDEEGSCVFEGNSNTKRPIKIGKDKGNGLFPIDIDGGDRLKYSAVWLVHYATDFYGAGYEGYTESKEFGKLVFVDWCPLEWSEPMEHYTVYWHFPYNVSGEKVTKEELSKFPIKTDKKTMNDSGYLIDYKGQKDEKGKYWLTMIVHKKNPKAYFKFNQKFYLSSEFFDLKKMDYNEFEKEKSSNYSNSAFGKVATLICGLLIIGLIIAHSKRKKISELPTNSWSEGEWVSPRVEVSTFGVKGKICKDLDNVEAAYLLEIDFSIITSIILKYLQSKKLLKIHSMDPLHLERKFVAGRVPENLYESIFLNAIKPDGSLNQKDIDEAFKEIGERVHTKMWDCDVEATKNYYRHLFETREPLVGEPDFFTYTRYYMYGAMINDLDHEIRDFSHYLTKANPDFQTFVKNDASFADACYNYSACHDACHDACHSACHDACHSACHSACHDACVSGGSR